MSDNIYEDLVVEIFTRLPPKSLIRFRSVSKSLCARIATPDFIRLNTIRSRIPKKVLLRHDIPYNEGFYIYYKRFYTLHLKNQLPLSPDHGYDGITPFKFPFPIKSKAGVVGSCNGIMLVIDNGDLILWNPIIRRKLKLPSHPLWRAFINVTGFAFDRVTEDYKIVTLSFNYEQNNDTYAFIYTMKTRTWCQISNPVTPSTYETREHLVNLFETKQGHLVNGVLHWVVRITNQSRRVSIHRYILTFDVSTHVFGMIELPEHEHSVKLTTTIHGSLAVITYEGDYARIWVRKENNTTPNWVSYLVFKSNVSERVMPLSINGNCLLNSYSPKGIEIYRNRSRARSRLVQFSDSSIMKDMSWFVESLELFDTGSPYKESKPSVRGTKSSTVGQKLYHERCMG